MPTSFSHPQELEAFQQTIGHVFRSPQLLQQALIHPSFSSQNKQFERLEFLGDRVLGLAMADVLFQKFPKDTEGSLAKRQAVLVSRVACLQVAKTLKLETLVRTVHDHAAQSNMETVLADAMEALLGALYLDAGFAVCRTFVERFWQDLLMTLQHPPKDAKSALQEWLQKRKRPMPDYHIVLTEGPAHQPRLVCEVRVDGATCFQAEGQSRREAEQKAAQQALDFLRAASPKKT